MRPCPQPIIALIHGAACGGGLSLALASDVRYAAPNARMNAAYIRIGLGGCDMGAGYLLPRLVGLSNASEFLLTGRFIDAERALRMGLVSEVVPAEKLAADGPRPCRGYAEDRADGTAHDQGCAQRRNRRAEPRGGAGHRGPPAGDPAGHGRPSRGGQGFPRETPSRSTTTREARRRRSSLPQPDQPLALVLSPVEQSPPKHPGRNSIPSRMSSTVTKLSGAHPVREPGDRRLPTIEIIDNNEALRAGALDEKMALEARSGRPRVPRSRTTPCRRSRRAPPTARRG